jgi:hypothetical protein
MNTSHRWGWGRGVARALVWVVTAASALLARAPAFAAGIEHPDIGTIPIGRGGAYAAAPTDGLALQYNPAGFAAQTGWRLTLDANLAWQDLSFAPATGATPVSNGAGPFLVGAGAVSYGFGRVGPLSGLTVALGLTTPSAIGRLSYPGPPSVPDAAQRYALIDSDYFIVYYGAAVGASWRWLSAGVTVQLAQGTAQFSQAVWSGAGVGTDPFQDSIAHIDVSSPVIPTAVFGVSARPMPPLALGLSYRPRFDFIAHGSLTTEIPQAQKDALGIAVVGDRTDFFLRFPDVLRFGAQYTFSPRLLVEADVVAEFWSTLHTIEIRPQDIHIRSENFGTDKVLQTIVFQKDFQDAVSLRVGGDYLLLPGRLTVRAGYLHETSAIPLRSVSVDFGNWQRDVVSIGGTVQLWRGISASFAYAHHFLADQHVTDTQVVQIVTPCLTPGCMDPAATPVGAGKYSASLDVASLSLGVVLDDLRARP